MKKVFLLLTFSFVASNVFCMEQGIGDYLVRTELPAIQVFSSFSLKLSAAASQKEEAGDQEKFASDSTFANNVRFCLGALETIILEEKNRHLADTFFRFLELHINQVADDGILRNRFDAVYTRFYDFPEASLR
jgi:hypothetical protein